MSDLRPLDEMLEIVEKESGQPQENIMLALPRFSENMADELKKDAALVLFLYATDVLKIPNTKLQTNVAMPKSEYVQISDVTKDTRGRFNVRGYFINRRESTTRNGHPKIALTLADESGVRVINFYNKAVDLIKKLDPPLKFGEPIYISGATVYKQEMFKESLSVSSQDEMGLENKTVTRIKAGEYKLPVWSDILTKEVKLNSPVLLTGTIIAVQKHDYIGCPKCTRGRKSASGEKMNVKEGESYVCNNVKRGCNNIEVVAVKHTLTTITIRDNLRKTRNIMLGPRMSISNAQAQASIASKLQVYGRVKDREDQVNAIIYNIEKVNYNTVKPTTQPNSLTSNVKVTDVQLQALKGAAEGLSGVASLLMKPNAEGWYELPKLKSIYEPTIVERWPGANVNFDMVIDYAKSNGLRIAFKDDLISFPNVKL